MPELPDVEGFRRYFSRHALGSKIRQVKVLDPTQLLKFYGGHCSTRYEAPRL